jgi:hypothetical protein
MLETVIVVSLFAALLLAGGGTAEPALDLRVSDTPADLPCPWCLAPTQEADVSCSACGQEFG